MFFKFPCQQIDELTFANKFNDTWDFHFLEITMIYCFASNFNITFMTRACYQEVKDRFCESSSFPFHYVPHHCLTFNHSHCKLVRYIVWPLGSKCSCSYDNPLHMK